MRERAAVTSGHRDRGQTLIETMVAVMIIMGFITALLILVVSGLKTQTMTERSGRVTGQTQIIMSKARQAEFATLGFYGNDVPAPASGNVTLPGLTTAGGGAITEQAVTLGPLRPTGTAPFAKALETFTEDGVSYRVRTWVTWVPNAGGIGTPSAKRITVQTQWGPAGVTLDGNCATVSTKCITQSSMRTATASDVNPVSGTAPVSTCVTGTAVICEAYIRSGRVLDGASMVSISDTPSQVDDVELFVQTASPATSVNASWSWKNAAGATVRTVNQPLTAGTDGTRWTATVAPDVGTSPTSVHKGDIRPGAATVRFTAVMGAGTVIKDIPAFWSYALADGPDQITATLSTAANWCSPVASGASPVTVNVTGHSIGFTETTQNPSATDRVDVVFTTTVGATTKTVTAPATLVPGSVVAQNQVAHDVITGGWVDASWTVTPPVTERCDNAAVSVVIYRATDQTSTPVVLQLPATTPTVPVLATPSLLLNNPATGTINAAWTTPPDATGFIYAYQVDSGAWVETNTTATTATIPVSVGQVVNVKVKATSTWSASGWSATATYSTAPAAPVVTTSRVGNAVTFTWAAVPGATDYWITSAVTPGNTWGEAVASQTATSYTVVVPRGQTLSVAVYARSTGGTSPFGAASNNVPLWEVPALQNGWVNYSPAGGTYPGVRYTRSDAGVVTLSGLVKGGTVASGTVLITLPPGYRPASQLIFETATSAATTTRMDINPAGQVFLVSPPAAASGWVSLDGLHFLAPDAPATRTTLTFANGWKNYGGGTVFAPMVAATDSVGRVHLQGLVDAGAVGHNVVMSPLAASLQSDQHLHFPTDAGGQLGTFGATTSVFTKTGMSNAWASVQAMYYPASKAGSWSTLTTGNGWKFYGGEFSTPQFVKGADGIVTLRGLLTGGTVTNGTVIATLPPGYRPAQNEIFIVANSTHSARVDVTATGDVVAREGVDNNYLALDAISFMAEQ